MNRLLPIVLVIFGISLLAACYPSPIRREPTAQVVGVFEHKNPHTFDLEYPVEWSAVIVTEGVMVFGPPHVVGIIEPGPSVTVYRIPAVGVTGTDQDVFDNFLRSGPLSGDFELSGPIEVARLGQYQGLGVDVDRERSGDLIAMQGKIRLVRTESGAVYIFSATGPSESWEQDWPRLSVILDSVQFNE